MPIPYIPPELLTKIFSCKALIESDYTKLVRVSKTFNALVMPLLYSHVTITTVLQSVSFQWVKKEDVGLIQSFTIAGNCNIWGRDDVEDLFEELAFLRFVAKEVGITHFILGGKVVAMQTTRHPQALYIRDVLDRGSLDYNSTYRLHPRITHNLVDLSIISHRAGHNSWKKALQRRYLPSLRRLAIYDVTHYHPPTELGLASSTGSSLCFAVSSSGIPLVQAIPGAEEDTVEELLRDCNFLDQLDLLVSPHFSFLALHPSLLHLAILSHNTPISSTVKYALVHIIDDGGEYDAQRRGVVRNSTQENTMVEQRTAVFDHLDQVLQGKTSLEYLCFPPAFKGALGEQEKVTLEKLKTKDVAIHWDGNLGYTIPPDSFYVFLTAKEGK